MICSKCMTENNENNKFCVGCGSELGTQAEPGATTVLTQQDYSRYQIGADASEDYSDMNSGSGETTVLVADQMPGWQAQQVQQYSAQQSQYRQPMQNRQPQQSPYYDPSMHMPQQQPAKKGGKKGILIAICVVLVIAIAAGVGVLAFKDKIFAPDSAEGSVTFTDESTTASESLPAADASEEAEESLTSATTEAATEATTKAASADTGDNVGTVLPDNTISSVRYYVGAEEGAVLRSGPGTNFAQLKVLATDTVVIAKGENNGNPDWYYVHVESIKRDGWINKENITTTAPELVSMGLREYELYEESFTMKVNDEEGLRMREHPSTSAGIVEVLGYEDTVEVLGYALNDPTWYYAKATINGKEYTCYVYSEYLS